MDNKIKNIFEESFRFFIKSRKLNCKSWNEKYFIKDKNSYISFDACHDQSNNRMRYTFDIKWENNILIFSIIPQAYPYSRGCHYYNENELLERKEAYKSIYATLNFINKYLFFLITTKPLDLSFPLHFERKNKQLLYIIIVDRAYQSISNMYISGSLDF